MSVPSNRRPPARKDFSAEERRWFRMRGLVAEGWWPQGPQERDEWEWMRDGMMPDAGYELKAAIDRAERLGLIACLGESHYCLTEAGKQRYEQNVEIAKAVGRA